MTRWLGIGAAAIGLGVVVWAVSREPSPALLEDYAAADPVAEIGANGAEAAEVSEEQTAPNPSDPPRYSAIPKIDVHVHVPASMTRGAMRLYAEYGIMMAINASAGSPSRGLENSVRAGRAAGGMYGYCLIDWQNAGEDDWNVRATLDACKELGAIGVKISKGLGLGYLHDGDLLAVDDPILDEAFQYAGELSLPIIIHTGDPKAFFEEPNEDNERFEELSAHPSWSFYGPRPDGGAWPSWRTLLAQFEARVARHPGTTFIGAHFGNAPEDPEFVGHMLEAYPNYYVETGARVPEIGRHDAAEMHAFFVRHQDRILFGTDFQVVPGAGLILGSTGRTLDGMERVPIFYNAHWRYFETDDEDFAHPSPIQGDWTIDGIYLPDDVLEKVYHTNAERIFGIQLSSLDSDASEAQSASEQAPPTPAE